MRLTTVLIACSMLAAQKQAPPAPSVIKVTARVVQVSVIVQDKKGDPVRDLTVEDFVLTDNGVEQKIGFFSKEIGEIVKPPAAKPAALPAGLVSNRYESTAALPNSITAILLDGLNTKILDQTDAKAGVIKFLSQLQPGDRVAIYTLNNGLKVLHDFTSDTRSLLQALSAHKNQQSFSEASSNFADGSSSIQAIDDLLNQSNNRIAQYYQTRRIDTTLKALQTIAHHLAGLPGRKNLIWLSGGFPLFEAYKDLGGRIRPDIGYFTAEMQRTIQALNDVGIAIYPVDARGLTGAFETMPSMDISTNLTQSTPVKNGGIVTMGEAVPTPTPNTGPRAMDDRAQNDFIATQGTMREIADRTGGRAFLNSNDIGGSIRRAMDDTRVSYVLGYTPSHNEWNGRFREIKIKVNRPGVDARYRKGYFAAANDNPRLRPALLVNAAMSPLPSTGLAMFAKLNMYPTREKPHAQAKVWLDAHEVSFTENDEGLWEANLDMLSVVGSESGEILSQMSRAVHLRLTGPLYADALKNGVFVTADMDAPEKSVKARIVVRDAGNGLLGSIDVPLTAPH